AEPLAAVGMHQARARRVQTGQLLIAERFAQILDLGSVRIGLDHGNLLLRRLPAIERTHAHVLNHQADVVVPTKDARVRLKQEINPLAGDGPADKQEAETLAGLETQ